MCSHRQNQLHPSNYDCQIQTVSLQPPFKGVRNFSMPEGYFPV